MWMVGFLDHEEKHGPSGASAQTMKEYEVSAIFIMLPNSTMDCVPARKTENKR